MQQYHIWRLSLNDDTLCFSSQTFDRLRSFPHIEMVPKKDQSVSTYGAASIDWLNA